MLVRLAESVRAPFLLLNVQSMVCLRFSVQLSSDVVEAFTHYSRNLFESYIKHIAWQ